MAKKKAAPKGDAPTTAAGVLRYQKFKVMRVSRKAINTAPYNPRMMDKSSFRRLKDGIKKHGLVDPLIVNVRDGRNVLVGGHQRLRALDELAESDDYMIDVSVIEVSESTEKKLNVLLNNPSVQGQFDLDMLQDLLGQLHEEGDDLKDTGFSTVDLHTMFGDEFLSGPFADQAENEAPEIAMLEDIRSAGKEVEQANSAAAGGTPAASQAAEGDESEEAEGEPAAADEAPQELTKEEFNQRRKEFIAKAEAHDDQADVIVTIVFNNSDQVTNFLKALDLDLTKRYFDAAEIAERIGIEF